MLIYLNSADDFTTGYMPSNAMVSFEGGIFWSPPARLLSSCKVDITYFPFDEQVCDLKFGSWTYDQAQVYIKYSAIVMYNQAQVNIFVHVMIKGKHVQLTLV